MKLKSALLAVLFASSAAVAMAQTPLPEADPLDDRSVKRVERMEKVVRELRAIVFQGRDTGKPVVVQPAETDAQIAALNDRVTDLEQTLTKLNGQNETVTFELNKANKATADQKARADALEQRLAAIEKTLADLQAAAANGQLAAGAAPAADGGAVPPPPPPPADPAVAFKQARQLLLDGDYANAEQAFSAYVANYPDNAKTPEARYWLGETLFVREAYTDAAAAARQARAAVAQTRAALNAAQVNLRFTTVPAPITGRIGRSLFTEGALVSATGSDNLATIQQLDPLYADFTQPAADLIRLRKGFEPLSLREREGPIACDGRVRGYALAESGAGQRRTMKG